MHIVQSPVWEKFKQFFGTPTIRVGGVLYTKHAIPFTGKFYAYCPKVDPFQINFENLKSSLKTEKCIAINFDVPNVLIDSSQASEAQQIFNHAGCEPSPKSTFTQYNFLLDISRSEEEILAGMHPKHRYNIKLAQKKGVEVREALDLDDLDVFYNLILQTAQRQNFFIHPYDYYRKMWEILGSEGFAKIFIASFQGKDLASWMFFIYDGVIYYPYGGSLLQDKDLHASNLLGWEGILLGKKMGCQVFDMWGACSNVNDTSDPYWGFSNFKQKFGARHVQYIPSQDLVLDPVGYKAFNVANRVRWAVLNFKRGSGGF